MSDISAFTGITKAANETAKGTRIVTKGEAMDKDAFLRILSAELANQDPENSKDSTQYVAQMAQFAGLEQMANLNNNMQLIGASGLIGSIVTLKLTDENGDPYQGLVKSIVKNGDSVKLNVLIGPEKTKEFTLSDVVIVE